jgi:hypothetical protein
MNFLRVQPWGKGLPIMRTMDRVRRLVRLGDERDLRQLPSAAQGIDAVRLMTIHGSKGLEFSVVHLPNFNLSTIPRAAQTPRCPPPDGMVDGGLGNSFDLLKLGHEEEQECLFYVAMSRAKDRFFAYAPTKTANGRKWSLSPYLSRLGGTISQANTTATRALPPAPEALPIELAIEGGLSFQGEQMRLIEKCPRRFFYTYILQIGGRRSSTAFMQMHEAVRTVYKAVVDGAVAADNPEQLNQRLADEFGAHGLGEHGYLEQYRKIALPMLQFFASIRKGRRAEKPAALSLTFGNERIVVMADDVVVNSEGQRTFRRIRTGHHRASHAEDVDSAALVIAARQAFPDAVVELVYLSDQKADSITMSDKQLDNRKEKLDGFLKNIRLGHFPAKPSPQTCPGCPAFFVCGPTPTGSLQRKF